MDTVQVRMTNLFRQLGLDASADGISSFISKHNLDPKTHITEASFWSDSQRALLIELLDSDADWAVVVDELSASLTVNKHKPH